MAYTKKVTGRIRQYNFITVDGDNIPTALSYSTQRLGTGDDEGASFPAIAEGAVTPGSLIDGAYVRTDLTALPASIRMQLEAIWSDEVHSEFQTSLGR